jgi:hypothetical protein
MAQPFRLALHSVPVLSLQQHLACSGGERRDWATEVETCKTKGK